MPGAGRPAGYAERAGRGRCAPVSGGAPVAVMLPGSGSDAAFVAAAFEAPLRAVGVRLVAPAPLPGRAVVQGL